MKPERAFVAERAITQHCPQLLRGGDSAPETLVPRLAAIGEPLARALAKALAPMSGAGDEPPAVRCGEVRSAVPAELMPGIAPLAANCLLAAGSPDHALLLSIEAKAVLRLIDRAFGGRGEAPAQMPDAFPLSAELLIARLERLIAGCLAQALGDSVAFECLRRDGSLDRLAPFAEGTPLAVLAIEVTETGGGAWQMTLAIPHATLPALLDGRKRAESSPAASDPARDPLAAPFGDMPLTVRAVLVDMPLPVSALSRLAPGQVLPVTVARSIPLRIGERTVAHGTVGALDECVAVQITQAY